MENTQSNGIVVQVENQPFTNAQIVSMDRGTVVEWIADDQRLNCVVCNSGFTFFNRRHHCRNCGDVVCGLCSSHRLVLDRKQYSGASRVCVNCFQMYVSSFNAHSSNVFTPREQASILEIPKPVPLQKIVTCHFYPKNKIVVSAYFHFECSKILEDNECIYPSKGGSSKDFVLCHLAILPHKQKTGWFPVQVCDEQVELFIRKSHQKGRSQGLFAYIDLNPNEHEKHEIHAIKHTPGHSPILSTIYSGLFLFAAIFTFFLWNNLPQRTPKFPKTQDFSLSAEEQESTWHYIFSINFLYAILVVMAGFFTTLPLIKLFDNRKRNQTNDQNSKSISQSDLQNVIRFSISAVKMRDPENETKDDAFISPKLEEICENGVRELIKAAKSKDGENDWYLDCVKNGVHCFLRHGVSGLVCFKGEVEVNASIEEVKNLLNNISRKHEYDSQFDTANSRVVQDLGTIHIVHLCYHAPPFITPRDFCNATIRRTLEDGTFIISAVSVESDDCPPQKGYIRAEALPGSGYLIFPLEDSKEAESKPRCKIVFVGQTDLCGLPEFAMKAMSHRQPMALAKVRSIVESV